MGTHDDETGLMQKTVSVLPLTHLHC